MNSTTNLELLREVHARYVGQGHQDEPAGAQEPAQEGSRRPGGGAAASGANGILDRIREFEFNFDNPPPAEPWLLSISGVEMCHPGNVTTIEALQKAGKTAFVCAAHASILAGGRAHLAWTSDGNPDGKAVLHFDTEQSRGHSDEAARRSLNRAEVTGPPPCWFKSWALRMLSVPELNSALEATMAHFSAEFGGIHSVWLDGGADFVKSVNEEETAVALVGKLGRLASQYHCTIVVVIHQNPGQHGEGGKSRGHLGSELYRKSETILRLHKDDNEITTVTSIYTRGAPLDRSNPVMFQFSQEAGMHMLLTPGEVVQVLAQQNDLAGIMRAVWGPDPEWTGRQVDVLRRMPDGAPSTKKRRLTELVEFGWVQRSGRIYGLLPAGRSQVQPEVQPVNEDNIPLAQAA
jgi:hypothetical protein